MATVDNAGITIYFEAEGSGPPLILQHGFTQSTARWHIDGTSMHSRTITV